MNNKIVFLIITMWIFLSTTSFAQRSEKAKEYYQTYMITKLSLTHTQAEKLWPIMEKYNDAVKTLRVPKDSSEDIKQITSDQATKILADHLATRRRELALYEQYIADLKQVLPIEKVAQLELLDRELRHKLMKRMKGGRPDHPQDRKRGEEE